MYSDSQEAPSVQQKELPIIRELLDTLNAQVEENLMIQERIENRFSPVLNPRPEERNNLTTDPGVLSPLASELAIISDRIAEHRRRMLNLIDSSEL